MGAIFQVLGHGSKMAFVVFTFLLLATAGYYFTVADVKTGCLKRPRVLYGSIEGGMASAKVAVRADYLNKTIRSGILRPIPDNVHDMLFFPVDIGSVCLEGIAIATYNPWYPPWAGAAPVLGKSPPYEKIRGGISEAEYEVYHDSVKCLIIGNGLFSKKLGDFELWYLQKE